MFEFFKKQIRRKGIFNPGCLCTDIDAFRAFIEGKKVLEDVYCGKIKFLDVKRDLNGYIRFIVFEVEA